MVLYNYTTVSELGIFPNLSVHVIISVTLICSIFVAYSFLLAVLFGHPTFWKDLLIERPTNNIYRCQYYFSTFTYLFTVHENNNLNEQSAVAPIKRVKSFSSMCNCGQLLSNHQQDSKINITEKLPEQILRYICKYLNGSDLLRIGITNHLMQTITNQKPLWKWLNQNTFGLKPFWEGTSNNDDERMPDFYLQSYDSETSTDSDRSGNHNLEMMGSMNINHNNHNENNKSIPHISITVTIRNDMAILKQNYFKRLNQYPQYLLSHISSSTNTNIITEDKYNKFNINITENKSSSNSNSNSNNNSGIHSPSSMISTTPSPLPTFSNLNLTNIIDTNHNHINTNTTATDDNEDEDTDNEEEEDETDVDTAIICVHQRIFILPSHFLQNGEHPGGSDILRHYHRRDATVLFDVASHSKKAKAMMKPFLFWDIARYRDVDEL